MEKNMANFSVERLGYGQYRVTYRNIFKGVEYSATTSNSILIDKTFNDDDPKEEDIEELFDLVCPTRPEEYLITEDGVIFHDDEDNEEWMNEIRGQFKK